MSGEKASPLTPAMIDALGILCDSPSGSATISNSTVAAALVRRGFVLAQAHGHSAYGVDYAITPRGRTAYTISQRQYERKAG